ncbi:MAG: hypothetical protein Q8T08_13340, partial [Ignavibacteria bacterium]|nr:hypothetical protein [Ignavibacteria bacterium]
SFKYSSSSEIPYELNDYAFVYVLKEDDNIQSSSEHTEWKFENRKGSLKLFKYDNSKLLIDVAIRTLNNS